MKLRSQISSTAIFAAMFTVAWFLLVKSKAATQSKKTLHKGSSRTLVLVEKTKHSEDKIKGGAIGWVVFDGFGIATIFTLVLIPLIYNLLAPLAPPRTHAGIRLSRELQDVEISNVRFG